jgi:Tfp pilus assembly protein PilO
MNRNQQIAFLRSKPVLIALAVAALVVLIWLVAFFLPEGSKASKLRTQQQGLENQVAQDNAKLALLKRTSQATPQLEALLTRYQNYVPPQPDVLSGPDAYVNLLDSTATSTGVTLTSINPGTPVAVPGLTFTGIPVAISAKGTYDALLAFLKAVYALPRLTSVQSVTVGGGGPNTNRSTVLTSAMNLQIYTTAKPIP